MKRYDLVFIYVMRGRDSGRIKIGWCETHQGIEQRRRDLQTGCPELLEIWTYWEDVKRSEQALHELWAHCHVVNEWFEPSQDPKLDDWLRRLRSAPVQVRPSLRLRSQDNIMVTFRPIIAGLLKKTFQLEPPVNLYRLLEEFNIGRVIAEPLKYLALLLPFQGELKVRSNQPPGQLRFTIAHELGHLLAGHPYDELGLTRADKGEEPTLKREADLLGSEVLFPYKWLMRHRDYSAEDLAAIFNSSVEAAEIALQRVSR